MKKKKKENEVQQVLRFICLSLMVFSATQGRFRMRALIFPIKHWLWIDF